MGSYRNSNYNLSNKSISNINANKFYGKVSIVKII